MEDPILHRKEDDAKVRRPVGVLCMTALAVVWLLPSCGANPPVSSPSAETTSSADSAAEDKTIATTTAEEVPAAEGSALSASETTAAREPTFVPQPTASLPEPPAGMTVADLDYWAKVDSVRVFHTCSPPYKAVTLQKGTKEFDALLSLLQQIEGTYLGGSLEGLYGGFVPIFMYRGTTELDRITINVAGDASFSTDTQQENSLAGLINTYASLYSLPAALSKEIAGFLETLEYTEDITPRTK